MRPPIWSAQPLLGSGTNNRMRVPAVMPRTGDTWWGTRQTCYIDTLGLRDTQSTTENSTTVFAKRPDVLCAAENISSLDSGSTFLCVARAQARRTPKGHSGAESRFVICEKPHEWPSATRHSCTARLMGYTRRACLCKCASARQKPRRDV